MSYRAYQNWAKNHPKEPSIPEFDSMTPNQHFWLSAAQCKLKDY